MFGMVDEGGHTHRGPLSRAPLNEMEVGGRAVGDAQRGDQPRIRDVTIPDQDVQAASAQTFGEHAGNKGFAYTALGCTDDDDGHLARGGLQRYPQLLTEPRSHCCRVTLTAAGKSQQLCIGEQRFSYTAHVDHHTHVGCVGCLNEGPEFTRRNAPRIIHIDCRRFLIACNEALCLVNA